MMRVTSILSVGSLLWAYPVSAGPCKPVTPSAASTTSVASVSSDVSSAATSVSSAVSSTLSSVISSVTSSVVSSVVSSVPSSVASSVPPSGPSTVCTKAGIINPSFSNGLSSWDTTTWSTNPNSFSVAAATSCGPDVNGVTYDSCAVLYSLAVNGNIGQASVYQANVPIVDGASYVLTFQYRITQPGSGILGCVVNGLTSASGISTVANTWITYSLPIVASGEVINIAPFQRSFGGSMTVQISNVKLESCITTGGTTTTLAVPIATSAAP
ncbi:hypothetical protein F503_08402 [Ophiostoma piceae UAMH 11346]|uniref:CBM-cenC domain-containing protein n=1 Tax=Ophiostoma piceae (strain UAMH 11346) TaxID=1262450 RepID=S3C2A8_OPHP1|nr:hypothetical protein F503_08402 [Ophiostoma piceae UAMH 11346]